MSWMQTCGCGLPDDNKKKLTPKDKIDLTIGVFFDGTCNNKYNNDSGKNKSGSYGGTWTNVASLWMNRSEEHTSELQSHS